MCIRTEDAWVLHIPRGGYWGDQVVTIHRSGLPDGSKFHCACLHHKVANSQTLVLSLWEMVARPPIWLSVRSAVSWRSAEQPMGRSTR